jgi:hypothetical protein
MPFRPVVLVLVVVRRVVCVSESSYVLIVGLQL